MRCSKCGYVSFDYLSECKKCRASLTAVRESFGFSAGKPAVPFLLGSLVSDYEAPALHENTAVEAETLTSFSFAEPTGDGPLQERPESVDGQTASVVAGPDGAQEDYSLLDLSDEELELLIDKEPIGDGEMEEIALATSAEGAGKSSPEPVSADGPASSALEISPPDGEIPSIPAAAPGEPVRNFDASPPDPEGQTSAFPALEPFPEFVVDPAALEQGPQALAEFGSMSEQHGDPANDFVIELSEDDLETLLEELARTPKDTA